MVGLLNCHNPSFHTINLTENNRRAKEEVTTHLFYNTDLLVGEMNFCNWLVHSNDHFLSFPIPFIIFPPILLVNYEEGGSNMIRNFSTSPPKDKFSHLSMQLF